MAGVEARLATLFRALCLALTGHGAEVDWTAFTAGEWEALGQMAQDQGVAPLLYWTFTQAGWPASATPGLRSSLTTAFYQSAALNAVLYQELETILNGLESAQIPVIVLKGAHLARNLYPDSSLRPMHDLDLLGREEDFERARIVLHSMGYSQPLAYLSQNLNRTLGYHQYLGKKDSDLPGVELHWGLLAGSKDRRAAPVAWFWETSQPYQPSAGAPNAWLTVRALAPTANLLYLAAHLFLKHRGVSGRLLWLYDVYLLLREHGEDVDWEVGLRKADEFDWTSALYGALLAAQEELGARLPEGLLEHLVSCYPDLSQQANRRGFRPQLQMAASWESLANLSWRARLQVWLAVLFPSPAHMRWRYDPHPAWLWPLYYPYKWAGMLAAAVRLWRGKPSG